MKYSLTPIKGKSTNQLAWMAGAWVGNHGTEKIEEHWSHPANKTMMGMFRWLRGDEVWFYELLVIEPEEDSLVMRIKHFYPGLKGWEEKDASIDFVLVSLKETEAAFLQRNRDEHQWLVYRLKETGQLVTYFAREDSETDRSDWFIYNLL
jgi:hypothetical protein